TGARAGSRSTTPMAAVAIRERRARRSSTWLLLVCGDAQRKSERPGADARLRLHSRRRRRRGRGGRPPFPPPVGARPLTIGVVLAGLNVPLRFFLEVAGVVAVAWWDAHAVDGARGGALALVSAGIFIGIWGLWIAPRAR